MANTSSAKKATRKIARRTEVNRSRRGRFAPSFARSRRRSPPATRPRPPSAFKAAEPEFMRAASKGVIHHNTASRKVARLAARVSAP